MTPSATATTTASTMAMIRYSISALVSQMNAVPGTATPAVPRPHRAARFPSGPLALSQALAHDR